MVIVDTLSQASVVLAVVFLLAFCWRGPGWPKTVVKTGAVGLLAVVGALEEVDPWLVAGLTLGSVGDFCLSRPGPRAFLAGLIAFALAHLAYVVWMVSPDYTLRALPMLALALFSAAMARVLWPRAGDLRGPVMAYVGIITAMGLAAVTAPGNPMPFVIAAGLFILSDAVLSLELFVLPEHHRARRFTPFIVWTTYWLAQWCFMLIGALAEMKLGW